MGRVHPAARLGYGGEVTALPHRPGLRAASALAALVAAGCATAPKPAPAPPPVATPTPVAPPAPPPKPEFSATPGLSARERVLKALGELGAGQPGPARAEITAFLQEQPDNALGKNLLQQIDGDPKTLLGAESFSYTTRPGETMSSLAERFLGDRFKFYILARYNGIDAPANMEVGRTLQIPGSPRRIAPPPRKPRPRISDEAAVADQLNGAKPAPAVSPPPAPVRPAPPRRDPAQAMRLRRQALDQMQAGSIDAAVRTLERALQLDPASGPIRSDLDRARRIQAAVRKR